MVENESEECSPHFDLGLVNLVRHDEKYGVGNIRRWIAETVVCKDEHCSHADCIELRMQAARRCLACGRLIGWRVTYLASQTHPTMVRHEACPTAQDYNQEEEKT